MQRKKINARKMFSTFAKASIDRRKRTLPLKGFPHASKILSGKLAGGAELAVVDHQEEVSGNHHQIENIQSQHPIDFAEHFVADTGDVADDDQPQKADTFADGILDFESFPDGNRPAGAETDQHNCFKKSHFYLHNLVIFVPDKG